MDDAGRGNGRPVVVLADADAAARLPLEVALLEAGFEVLPAGSEGEALAALARRPVDLLIADADLISGFAAEVGRQLGATGAPQSPRGNDDGRRLPLLLLANGGTLAARAQAIDVAVDDLLVRPVWSRELVARARLLLQRQLQAELASTAVPTRPSLEGSLGEIAVGDVLRSVELNRRSGTIRLANEDGTEGIIYFREGSAVDAELGSLTGREAIARLLAFREGTFVVTWGPVARRDVVGSSPRALVLEGVRRRSSPPSPTRVAAAREPGVERRGAVLSGTIQDNRGTGSTALGWAPAFPRPSAPAAPEAQVRRRNLRIAILGAGVAAVLVALLFLLPTGAAPTGDQARPVRTSAPVGALERAGAAAGQDPTRPAADGYDPTGSTGANPRDDATDPYSSGPSAAGLPSTDPNVRPGSGRSTAGGEMRASSVTGPDGRDPTFARGSSRSGGDRYSTSPSAAGGDLAAADPTDPGVPWGSARPAPAFGRPAGVGAPAPSASRGGFPSDESLYPERTPSAVHACRDAHALDRPPRTVEVCTRAFLALPDSATIASILARAELDQGHFDLAGKWARRAVDLDPTLPDPHALLGFAADKAGHRRAARASYRRYLQLAPRGAYAADITAILGRN